MSLEAETTIIKIIEAQINKRRKGTGQAKNFGASKSEKKETVSSKYSMIYKFKNITYIYLKNYPIL